MRRPWLPPKKRLWQKEDCGNEGDTKVQKGKEQAGYGPAQVVPFEKKKLPFWVSWGTRRRFMEEGSGGGIRRLSGKRASPRRT